ncbi:MAG: transposase [Pseudonocardiales bacterium]|jgi:transposase|nr:transposase [Pseudonocardiales bacterium]
MSEPATITSPHVPDVDDVRQWMERMIKSLRFVDLVVAVIAFITRMRDLNTELTRRMADMRKSRPKSETLRRVEGQLLFAFGIFVPLIIEEETSSTDDETTSGSAGPNEPPKKKARPRHPGRAGLPKHLERVSEVNHVPPDLRTCPLCGEPMKTVAHSMCEILDVRPATLFVRQRLDERVACPNDDTIVSAPPPPALVERGKLGTTLIIESLADKYLEHQPIERQCLRWSRTGVDIAPQTLGRSVAVAIDTLAPVARMIEAQTRAPGLLATDATGIPVLDRDAPGGIRNGTMWCWTNARWVSFIYSPEGDSASVRRFLGEDLRRRVQCDGTNITTFLERTGGQRPGCWSHARRGFVEPARAGDKIALEALHKMGPLFLVERQSVIDGDNAAQRLSRRTEHSVPAVERLRVWLEEKRATVPPKTPLGAALGYLHRQWKRLVLFLGDGNIELTNNRVERELRKLVLGRRNWLFTWEDLGGERTASILTIIATCVSYGVNPRAYLHLATKLIINNWPQAKLRELLPDRLAIAHTDLLLRDGAFRSPLLGLVQDPPATAS